MTFVLVVAEEELRRLHPLQLQLQLLLQPQLLLRPRRQLPVQQLLQQRQPRQLLQRR